MATIVAFNLTNQQALAEDPLSHPSYGGTLAVEWEIQNGTPQTITSAKKTKIEDAVADLRNKISDELLNTNVISSSGMVDVTGKVKKTRVFMNTQPPTSIDIQVSGNATEGFTAQIVIPAAEIIVIYYQ